MLRSIGLFLALIAVAAFMTNPAFAVSSDDSRCYCPDIQKREQIQLNRGCGVVLLQKLKSIKCVITKATCSDPVGDQYPTGAACTDKKTGCIYSCTLTTSNGETVVCDENWAGCKYGPLPKPVSGTNY